MATNWLRSKVKLRVIQCEGVALDLLPRVLLLLLPLVPLVAVLVLVCHLTSVAAVTVSAVRVAAVAVAPTIVVARTANGNK